METREEDDGAGFGVVLVVVELVKLTAVVDQPKIIDDGRRCRIWLVRLGRLRREKERAGYGGGGWERDAGSVGNADDC